MDIAQWLAALDEQLTFLRELDDEYPIQDTVSAPDAEHLTQFIEATGLAPDDELVRFYEACDGVSLMSIHNGYRIHGISGVLRLMDDEEGLEPVCLETDSESKILVFGSDGGGSRFARRANGGVVFLPSGGAVLRGTYYDEDSPVVLLAPTFFGFLARLLEDVTHFVEADEEWLYMAQ
jgi:hypothetical protein